MNALLQATTLVEGTLLLLPHFEAEAAAHGLSANCYAYINKNQAILMDAVFADTLPQIVKMQEQGFKITPLVISHRHVAAQADALPDLLQHFPIPVFLHPIEAAHPQAKRWRNLNFLDPMHSQLLNSMGLAPLLFAGHTRGHIMLYASGRRILLAGDCATGSPVSSTEPTLIRPPEFFNIDDEQLRKNWDQFNAPVDTVAPYHGQPLVNNQAAIQKALDSLRKMAPTTSLA